MNSRVPDAPSEGPSLGAGFAVFHAPLHILADDRERGSSALRALQAMPDVEVQIQHLRVGDYLVEDLLLVERKTLPDLLASIEDGRLFRQARALSRSGKRGLLLLEGRAETIQDRAMGRQAIQGALLSLALAWGIPVLRAMDGHESAGLLRMAARQIRRAYVPSALHPALPPGLPPGRCPNALKRAQTYLLQGLPGIGMRIALRLLDRFGTAEGVMTASAEDLRQIPGIGERRADRIRWILKTSWKA